MTVSSVKKNLNRDFDRKRTVDENVIRRMKDNLSKMNKLLSKYCRNGESMERYSDEIKSVKNEIRSLKREINQFNNVISENGNSLKFIDNFDINDYNKSDISKYMFKLKEHNGLFNSSLMENFMGTGETVALVYDKNESRLFGDEDSQQLLHELINAGAKVIIYGYDHKNRKVTNFIKNMCSSMGTRVVAWVND